MPFIIRVENFLSPKVRNFPHPPQAFAVLRITFSNKNRTVILGISFADTDSERGIEIMKLLIASDGSACAEAALDDLQLAGLPEEAEALVISVAEAWLPPTSKNDLEESATEEPYIESNVRKHRAKAENAVSEAAALAGKAAERLRRNFRNWNVKTEAAFGSPAWEILAKAEEFKPDLIVIGSHGRTAVGRLFLGSISQKVLTEARCSVRVARGRVEIDPYPSRIIIGFDDTIGAHAAVEAVAGRHWREKSEVRLVTAIDPLVPMTIGGFVEPVVNWSEEELKIERLHFEEKAEKCLRQLRNSGLTATFHAEAGNPKQLLVEEAHNWRADSIFVGANAHGKFERFLLGSVSAAVAVRAHCSVEVVR